MSRKDLRIKERHLKSYMNKIYSITPNCWFHDLIDQGDHEPHYWHLFVGVNTRFMYALPLNSKSTADVKETLTKFINEFHPKKLTSDEEAAFTSKEIVKLCTDNKVQLYIVTDKNHSSLGVIDRITAYNSRTNKYDVVFKLPDGSEYNDTIPASFLRNHNPQIRSKIENEFFANQNH